MRSTPFGVVNCRDWCASFPRVSPAVIERFDHFVVLLGISMTVLNHLETTHAPIYVKFYIKTGFRRNDPDRIEHLNSPRCNLG